MTPKERFLQDGKVSNAWNDVADGGLFLIASEQAMLEVMTRLASKPGQVYEAQSRAHMIAGMILFQDTLKNLGKAALPGRALDEDGLEYESHKVAPGMTPVKTTAEMPMEGEGLR